jgi:hypothetical protein
MKANDSSSFLFKLPFDHHLTSATNRRRDVRIAIFHRRRTCTATPPPPTLIVPQQQSLKKQQHLRRHYQQFKLPDMLFARRFIETMLLLVYLLLDPWLLAHCPHRKQFRRWCISC